MRIAILLLCHEAPLRVAGLLRSPFFHNDDIKVYIHYDGKRSKFELDRLKDALPVGIQYAFVSDRVVCKWGEYSLVDATHRLMKLALRDPAFKADYFALISGSCTPIRPFTSLQEFLKRRRGIDFIQCHDISRGRWIRDGLEIERCHYYFPFNFISQRKWFERLTNLQRSLKIHRQIPEGLHIHFGSQWFCLSRETSEQVAQQLDVPELQRFFQHCWIPDEFAIQTLVAGAQKVARRSGYTLTYYEFDEQGCPLVLDNGHFEHLLRQPFFFARKFAPEARHLSADVHAYTATMEYDLSYFDRVGTPTSDYRKFLSRAQSSKAVRAHVGTVKDPWRGPMDVSSRRYLVLYSSSRSYLLELLGAARRSSNLPIFDLPFDNRGMIIARDRNTFYGFQASDRMRRDYDPAAFLHELVHVHPSEAIAFGLDPTTGGWVRDFVQWDRNAVLVNCDRLDLSLEQKAAAILREMDSAHDAQVLAQTLTAARAGSTLPHDHFHRIWESKEYSCSFIALHSHGESWNDPTLQALRSAAWQVDSNKWFPDQALARTLLEA